MTLAALAFAVAAVFSTSAMSATRDLVFDDDEDAAAAADDSKQTIAVKTTVQLTRDGQTSNVAPSAEFKSGDKVKLVFTPNVDGYVYWMAKGSSGQYALLYPSAKAGMDNAVSRNQEYTVPAKGAFKFDDQPGDENLLCILSTDKIPELEQAAGNMTAAAPEIDQIEKTNQQKRQTRDLVFDDEEDEEINTTSQVANKGEPFVAQYTLSHK